MSGTGQHPQHRGHARRGLMMAAVYGVVFLLFGGETPNAATDVLTIDTGPLCQGTSLSIEVIPGDQWVESVRVVFLAIRTAPQMVIWSEDRHGQFLDTLFITRKMGTQRWGQDADPQTLLYPEALPSWLFGRSTQGVPWPTRDQSMPDAITAATPKRPFRVSTRVCSHQPQIVIVLEVNMSLDFNAVYTVNAPAGTQTYNKRSGQPALVYRADVDLQRPGRYEMRLVGHSHPSGANGRLFSDLRSLTTALQLIERAVVSVDAVNGPVPQNADRGKEFFQNPPPLPPS